VIYDEEFTDSVDRALADKPDTTRIVGWTDHPENHDTTVETLVTTHLGARPVNTGRKGRLILLTSGTTGNPKGAKHSGGGTTELKAMLERVPWHTEETTVVVAPMFHAWGFSQLIFAASMGCTVVTRRKFDPEATLELIDRHQATGLCVVPVMFDRIMDLPDDVRRRYSGRSLRFATASGSRMRPDVVTRFHGRLRRHPLQQLQRHRSRHDRHRDAGGSARRAGHCGKTRHRHRDSHSRQRPSPGAHRRGRPDLRPQHQPVRWLHLRRGQELSRRLHGIR